MSTPKTATTVREGTLTGTVLIPVGTAFPAKVDNVTVKRTVDNDGTEQTILLKADAWLASISDDVTGDKRTEAVLSSVEKGFDLLDMIEAAGGTVREAGTSESGLTEKYRFSLDFDDNNAVTVRLPLPNRDTGEINPAYSQVWTHQVDPEDDSLIRIGEMSEETDDDGELIVTTKPFRLVSVGAWTVTETLDSDGIKSARERAKERLTTGSTDETPEVSPPSEMSDPDPLAKG